jgi:hypothetical protein
VARLWHESASRLGRRSKEKPHGSTRVSRRLPVPRGWGPTLYRTLYTDSNGRQRQKRGFSSPSAAAKFRARMQVRAERGELRITRETFAEQFDTWLKGHHRGSKGTRDGYRAAGERRLEPFFGPVRLSAIEVQTVRNFVGVIVGLVEVGELAPKTVNNTLTCLSACLKDASRCTRSRRTDASTLDTCSRATSNATGSCTPDGSTHPRRRSAAQAAELALSAPIAIRSGTGGGINTEERRQTNRAIRQAPDRFDETAAHLAFQRVMGSHSITTVISDLILHQLGWRITHLGADTPLAMLASAAKQIDPDPNRCRHLHQQGHPKPRTPRADLGDWPLIIAAPAQPLKKQIALTQHALKPTPSRPRLPSAAIRTQPASRRNRRRTRDPSQRGQT